AFLYRAQGKYHRAEPLLREAVEGARKKPGLAHPSTQTFLGNLADCYEKMGQPAQGEPLLRELLVMRQKTQPDAWTTFQTQSQLGGSLLGQRKYAEAEPLLLAGYQGMKQREAKIPATQKARLTEALERLVQLYNATGQKDKADKWRQKLQERKA